MRITFKKITRRRCGDPQMVAINVDGKSSGLIQQLGSKWFWYANPNGVSVNTINFPKSLDECKLEIKKAFKESK